MDTVTVEVFLEMSKSHPVLDVRSPGEFSRGHIPGAVSLPLLDDSQRAEVGTIYAQASPREAFLRGLDHIGPRLPGLVRQALKLCQEGKALVHCWRGGQRSHSVAWILEQAGLQAVVLKGGYRAFRQYIREYLARPRHFLRIAGLTGCGKTEILHKLGEAGHVILDLEGLASHKGSAFGAIGMPPQPHYESFEIELYRVLSGIESSRTVLVEDEGRSIGRLMLPLELFRLIKASPAVMIRRSRENRVRRLVEEYTCAPRQELLSGVQRITDRLGGLRTREVSEHIQAGRMAEAVSAILDYYDKAYINSGTRADSCPVVIDSDQDADILESIQDYLKETEHGH